MFHKLYTKFWHLLARLLRRIFSPKNMRTIRLGLELRNVQKNKNNIYYFGVNINVFPSGHPLEIHPGTIGPRRQEYNTFFQAFN